MYKKSLNKAMKRRVHNGYLLQRTPAAEKEYRLFYGRRSQSFTPSLDSRGRLCRMLPLKS